MKKNIFYYIFITIITVDNIFSVNKNIIQLQNKYQSTTQTIIPLGNNKNNIYARSALQSGTGSPSEFINNTTKKKENAEYSSFNNNSLYNQTPQSAYNTDNNYSALELSPEEEREFEEFFTALLYDDNQNYQ